jgi:hypothetical protein
LRREAQYGEESAIRRERRPEVTALVLAADGETPPLGAR